MLPDVTTSSATVPGAASYRPRNSSHTPLSRLMRDHLETFLASYEQRHREHYGHMRPEVDSAVIDVGACLDYLDRHGPFDPERAEKTLHRLLGQMPNDQHILLFLDAIRKDHNGEQP